MTVVFVLLGLALALAAGSWFVPVGARLRFVLPVGAVCCLAVVGAVLWWGGGADRWSQGHDTLVMLAGVLAVAGGGPATVAVFRLVDGEPRPGRDPDETGDGSTSDRDSVEAAGEVLRGGAWIGGLERAAVFATVVSGWPEGLAIILALKGLARYPELRGPAGHSVPEVVVSHGVAERFIIGTFVSVLWALACAGVALS